MEASSHLPGHLPVSHFEPPEPAALFSGRAWLPRRVHRKQAAWRRSGRTNVAAFRDGPPRWQGGCASRGPRGREGGSFVPDCWRRRRVATWQLTSDTSFGPCIRPCGRAPKPIPIAYGIDSARDIVVTRIEWLTSGHLSKWNRAVIPTAAAAGAGRSVAGT